MNVLRRIELAEMGLRKMNSPPAATVVEFKDPSEIWVLRRREKERLVQQYGTAEKTMILLCEKINMRRKRR